MADDDIDIEGEFELKLETEDGLYDANELPSKSANLLPEFTNPPWMLEQGWSLDNCMDEKSKATIEKMLLEEQQYFNGRKKGKYLGINKSVLLITATTSRAQQEPVSKRQWTDEEKKLFLTGLEKYGNSWSKIARLIPSRTTIQVKNYAQQYMKSLARRSELRHQDYTLNSLPSTKTASALGPSPPLTVSVTSASDTLADVAVVITTAQPTIIFHPCRTSVRPSTKFVRRKTVSLKATGHENSVNCLLNTNHSESVFFEVNGVKNENPSSQINSDVKEEIKCDVRVDSVATVSSDKTIENNDSESEEVDIDIENDDGHENVILQSRSASPSSVYDKLLQQANVTVNSASDALCAEEGAGDKEKGRGELCKVSSIEDANNKLQESADALLHNFDSADSSSENIYKAEPLTDGMEENDREFVEEKLLGLKEMKHIVNGVLSSSGQVFEFPIPIEDKKLEADRITKEEKMVHSEFFDGRPQKTPERYLKIRNYILDCWRKSRPVYLNKTSVRPGLKNCGDVNCIGRIHTYLECIGSINFGCEQAAYNNLGKGTAVLSKSKHTSKEHHLVKSATKLEAMRPRKRRIRDSSGDWVDEKELEGKTIEHKPENKGQERTKVNRGPKLFYDPFKLVPCEPFTLEKQAPFSLEVLNTALAVMDIHAHISRTEVIGMLGGQFDKESSCLNISMAVPCKSISTGMQCEMDPVSQTHASEQIEDVGLQVVGWYHSHPTFVPNPSVRDIETQKKFQHWFAQGGSHFVGIIISPYSPQNTSVISDIRCLTISDDIAREFLCNRPYQFSYVVAYRDNLREILAPASELAEKYCNYSSRVALSCIYKPSVGITCLSKMLQSVKYRLEPPDPEHPIPGSRSKVEDVLHWLEQIFLEKFTPTSSADVSDASMATSVPLATTDEDEEQVRL